MKRQVVASAAGRHGDPARPDLQFAGHQKQIKNGSLFSRYFSPFLNFSSYSWRPSGKTLSRQ
jgi:hypothetical protein